MSVDVPPTVNASLVHLVRERRLMLVSEPSKPATTEGVATALLVMSSHASSDWKNEMSEATDRLEISERP